jgi:hypothetical protein
MNKSYLAGMFDGDGSIVIGRIVKGFQIKVELTQCNREFIENVNSFFNNAGKIYDDSRSEKYKDEDAVQLRFTGCAAIPVLELMRENAVIKCKQAELGLKYLSIQGQQHMYTEREQIYLQMKALNAHKEYIKPYERVNNAYISGLFDAEGNVYSAINNKNKKKYYVKITQKCDPELIRQIQLFLGFGKISPCEPYRLRFFSKADIFAFHSIIEDTNVMKIYKLLDLLSILI